MNIIHRIKNNLSEEQLSFMRRSIGYRVVEAFVISMQTVIAIMAIYFIYNDTGSLTHYILLSLSILSIFGLRRLLAFYALNELFKTAYDVGFKIRKTLLQHMVKMPLGALSELHIGKISQTLSEDISWVEDLVSFVGPNGVANILNAFILFFMTFLLDWRIALVVAVNLVAGITILLIFRHKSKFGLKMRSQGLSDAALRTIEFVQGMQILRTFGGFKAKETNFQSSIERLRIGFIQANKKFAKILSIFFFFLDSAVAVAIITASYLLVENTDNAFSILAAMIIMLAAFVPLRGAIAFILVGNLAQTAHENLSEVEAHKTLEISNKKVQLTSHDIVFDHVSFAYKKEQTVIDQLSFEAKQKSMTAIVGPSGAGKSTIINLLARFWEIESGTISIGGHNIKDMSLESLLSQISMVMQDVKLFNQSIYENIALGRADASKEEVIEAAKKANAHDFIMALPNGYGTEVGESGARFSGGERQRISIARAILKDSPIILLDEATSSIDPENEVEIQSAISRLTQDKTLIVIAHRLSTIMDADQILVMDDGKLLASGTHATLIQNSDLYKRLWDHHTQITGWKI